ncbi:MAG: hypothetical protein IKX03_06275 [Bacteroidales bacterium]|nr:hypothetical protein [Bacteroidales bacterium]
MKKVLLIMIAASLMLAGCKPKTEKVEGTETEVKECCQKQEGDCCKKADGECCKQDAACCEKKDGECCKKEDCKKHDEGCCKKNDGECCKKEGCEKHQGECCKKQENANGGGVADDKKTGKVEANLACPVELNIAKIVELVDKAEAAGKVTPELKKEYDALAKHASECLECGGCERRSKSGVKIVEKMQKAVKLFGK